MANQTTGTRLISDTDWVAIVERVNAGQATQEDAAELMRECDRLGRIAISWRDLVQVWNEYAEHLRVRLSEMRDEIEEVDIDEIAEGVRRGHQ